MAGMMQNDGNGRRKERKKEEEYRVPAVENVVCMDTTGAGDSFTAGFLYMLSEERGLRDCAIFANRCGAKAVESVGATKWIATES